MKDENMESMEKRNALFEEFSLRIQLMEEEYKRTPEYRKERRKDRFLYFWCVVYLAFIILIFVDVILGMFK